MRNILIATIRLYQRTISPDHGWFRGRFPHGYCRFSPTCSQYAIDAIEKYGSLKGSWLALRRIARCNPFSKPGLDPVR